MDSVKIIIFDEETITQTLIEEYLKELIFPYILEKYGEFDEGLINNFDENKIIIFNINKFNTDILDKISALSNNPQNIFIAISYDDSTDLRVKILRTGTKDFLLKPLIKSDFVYSLQQIYKRYIQKTNTISICKIFSVLSNEINQEISFFITNTAKEIENISNEKTLIIDIPTERNYISELYNFKSNSNNEILKYKNSSLYLVNINTEKLNTTYIKNLINILKPEYRYIFINLSGNIQSEFKQDFITVSDSVLYLSTFNFNIDKLKKELNVLCNNIKTKLILNRFEIRNKNQIKKVQFRIGKSVNFIIPQNCMAAENSLNQGLTLNEYNKDYDISQKYVSLAKEIMNRV
ncbi:hypothetical protein IJ182_06865 [bacterium]|nr:hypothetical protein [bacterium]